MLLTLTNHQKSSRASGRSYTVLDPCCTLVQWEIKMCVCVFDLQGPPGSFDFLLLLMADIRNDIADLQSKVYGRPMHSPEEDFPAVPDSWRDSVDAGSGEDYREPPSPRTGGGGGGGAKRNRKRKPARERTDWFKWFILAVNIELYCMQFDDRCLFLYDYIKIIF